MSSFEASAGSPLSFRVSHAMRWETLIIAMFGASFALVAVFSSQSWVGVVLLSAMLLPLVLYRWPFGAVTMLMIASAMPRFRGKLFSLTVKPEHVITGLIVVCIVFIYRRQMRGFGKIDLLLLAFLGTNFISSIVVSPEPRSTFTHAVLFLLVVLPYWIVATLVNTHARFRIACKILLTIGVLEAAFGIGCWLAHQIAGTTVGITYYTYLQGLPGVHGSQWEPNIFGSYVASSAAILVFLQLHRASNSRWLAPSLALTVIATLLSMARAAWLGLFLAYIFALLTSRRNEEHRSRLWKKMLFTASLMTITATLVMSIPALRDRAMSLAPSSVLEDTTLVHRLVYMGKAVDDIQQQPWLGHGTESFELFWDWDTDEGEAGAWIGNVGLRILHDVGIAGLLLFSMFAIALFRGAYGSWKRNRNNLSGGFIGGLLAAQIVFAVAYQFTEATLLAFTWANLGLVAAASRLPSLDEDGSSVLRLDRAEQRQK